MTQNIWEKELEMKVGDKTYRRVKGHYETDGSGRATWVTWELVK